MIDYKTRLLELYNQKRNDYCRKLREGEISDEEFPDNFFIMLEVANEEINRLEEKSHSQIRLASDLGALGASEYYKRYL